MFIHISDMLYATEINVQCFFTHVLNSVSCISVHVQWFSNAYSFLGALILLDHPMNSVI